MKIAHIIGARPNFMKVAPVVKALNQHEDVNQVLIHSGQHYDTNMSEVFFRQLELPEPDVNLEVGSGSHAVQTAQVMIRLEEFFLKDRPDWVLVYGDINSTAAAALVCAKMLIPIGHVEAGLRSFDRAMPEEVNRLVTDSLADLLFTPSADGDENLLREGVSAAKIHMVGNVMIDTLVRLLPKAEAGWSTLQANLSIESRYGLVTLHRPSNVDDPDMLSSLLEVLGEISRELPLIFPIHPRTRGRMKDMGLTAADTLRLAEPMGYLDFLALQRHAAVVITDSGGVQEETTYLGTPCLTLRENTERPVTVTVGTNKLIGHDLQRLQQEVSTILQGQQKQGSIPPLVGRQSWRAYRHCFMRDLILLLRKQGEYHPIFHWKNADSLA